MDFWDTFWATMWGAVAGAVVGVLGSWLFALDMQRRSKVQADRQRLDSAVANVIQLLGDFSGATQAFMFAANSPTVQAASPHVSRQRLLSAITVGLMAVGDQDGPLQAVFTLVTAQDDKTANQRGLDYEHAARTLVQWRRGVLSAKDAAASIRGGFSQHDISGGAE